MADPTTKVDAVAQGMPIGAFDRTYDVVVIGSGAGGMSAAITAAKQGLDVLVMEKSEFVGGSTAVSGGAVWIPENHHAAGAGHADTREAALSYLSVVLGNRLKVDLVKAFLDAGPEMVRFFESQTSVHFEARPYSPDYRPEIEGASMGGRTIDPVPFDARKLGADFALLRPPLPQFTILGGMMVNRKDIHALVHRFQSFAHFRHGATLLLRHARDRLRHARGARLLMGNALAARLLCSARLAGIGIVTRTEAAELLTQSGQVVGVTAQSHAGTLRIASRRGVVLACGGFPADADRRQALVPHHSVHRSMAPSSNTGDGLHLALAVGGTISQGNSGAAFWTPVSVIMNADGSETNVPHLILDRAKPGLIAVDGGGRRFVNEATSYHAFVDAMHEAGAVPAFLICDSRFLKRYGLGAVHPGRRSVSAFVRSGYLVRADSIAELARTLDLPPGPLKEAVAGMNAAAQSGEDGAFGKGATEYNRYLGDPDHWPNPCLGPIETPPFYAVRVWPGDIGTATGLVCDASARVLDRDGRPIGGLYAVGNDMNSIMAGAYPGAGITLGPALTFGFIAGRSLAVETDRLGGVSRAESPPNAGA